MQNPTPPTPVPPVLSILRFTHGLHFYSIGYLHRALAPTGLTPTGIAHLLRTLDVPTLKIGRIRYVNMFWFSLALFSLSRISSPSRDLAGSPSHRKRPTVRLTNSEIKRLAAELLYARQIQSRILLSDADMAARIAALTTSLLDAGCLPSATAAAYREKALEFLRGHHNPTRSRKRRPRRSSASTPQPLPPDPAPPSPPSP